MKKLMKIFIWIPVLNVVAFLMLIINYIRQGNIKKNPILLVVWLGIMFGAAIVRAIATIILSQFNLFFIIDIVNYFTISLSFTIVDLIFLMQQ